jgi:hypothetical protein
MLASPALRTGIAPGGALAPKWVSDALWRRARAVPSLDQRFADTKSLIDSVTGQQLITHTRASSATFINSQGQVQTATTNLLLRSEEFDNASWIKGGNIQVSANTIVAPNGTITAERLSSDGTQIGFIEQSVSVISGLTYTVSCYLKKHNTSTVIILFYGAQFNSGGSNIVATFNLDTGVATVAGGGTASMIPVGDGWYRCRLSKDATSTTTNNQQIVRLASNSGDVYAWGAQLEQSSTVGEYVPTTSTINSAPRFTHDPVTLESLGLLVEEQRTNSIRNNTMVGAVAGTPGTLPTNWATSGLGTLTQQVVGVGTENGVNYIDLRFSGTTSTTQLGIRLEPATGAAGTNNQTFTFSTWAARVGGSTANIGDIGANANIYNSSAAYLTSIAFVGYPVTLGTSFTRLSGSGTIASATAAFIQPQIYINFSSGVAIDITFRIGLPQLEQGAFATSVILTSGTAVTRSADVVSITGSAFSSWYRQDEGTIYYDGTISQGLTGFPWFYNITDGTVNNSIGTYQFTNGVYGSTVAGGIAATPDPAVLFTPVAGSNVKHALAVKSLDTRAALNSTLSSAQTNTIMPVVNQLAIGTRVNANRMTGTIRRLTYWPQRLSNTTLQALTQ